MYNIILFYTNCVSIVSVLDLSLIIIITIMRVMTLICAIVYNSVQP